ncbi:tash protein pest motif family protein [Burkholderia pseudomallei]|uniref:Tash protein pest motif family protein n=1 Tax=Burkholderia pseudomallei TaxID=28450 RepID=A0AA40JJL4_BURPE|nr:tash protein pest motif family protein [Burkholderia pseudomallei]
MVARKNPVQPTNCDKRLRKYDTSVQVRRTGVSARRRNPPAAGVMRRSAPRAAVAGAACRDARRRCARTRSSRVCATPHRSPRGSPLRGPRARGRAHGPPFRLSNFGRGTLAVFRRMRCRGSGSRMSDFRRRIRRRSRRCASGPIEPATRSEPRGRFGCRACAEWFHMHPARVPMGSRWRRDYAAIALRLGIGGRLSPRLERRAAARRACARGFRGIDDSRPRTAENARAECQMPDAGCRHRWREGPFSPPLRFVGRFAQRRNGFEHATAAR